MFLAFDQQGGGIVGSGLQVIESPARYFLRTPCNPQQRRSLSRRKGNIEAVQRNRESTAERLHISLFAGPAFEECLHLLLCRQGQKDLRLARRKETVSNLLCAKIRTEQFNIHPDFQSGSHSQQRVFPGMGEVEPEVPRVEFRLEIGLLLRAIGEPYLLRPDLQVAAQHIAQHGTGNGEAVLVFRAMEAVGAGQLVRSQQGAAALDSGFRLDEVDAPEMYLVGFQGIDFGSSGPDHSSLSLHKPSVYPQKVQR